MTGVLTHDEARAYYDGFGAKQDKQSWYEEAALSVLCDHGKFKTATKVWEFGCGTGTFAKRLFEHERQRTISPIGQRLLVRRSPYESETGRRMPPIEDGKTNFPRRMEHSIVPDCQPL